MPLTIQTLFSRMLMCGVLGGACLPAEAWAESGDAPATPTSRLQLSEEQYFEYRTFSPPGVPDQTGSSVGGGTNLSATIYFHPLRDDGTPRALQPFLQRASTFWLQARGSVTDHMSSIADQSSGEHLTKQLGAGLAADVYVRDFLILSASLGVNFHIWSVAQPGQVSTNEVLVELLPVSIGVGLRTGDTRFDVAYQVAPVTLLPPASVLAGSQLSAAVRTVLKQRVEISFRCALLDQGGAATAGFRLFPTRDFGIFGSVSYGHGRLDPSLGFQTVADRLSGRLGVSYWAARTLGVLLSYLPTWDSDGGSMMTHVVALTLDSRL